MRKFILQGREIFNPDTGLIEFYENAETELTEDEIKALRNISHNPLCSHPKCKLCVLSEKLKKVLE